MDQSSSTGEVSEPTGVGVAAPRRRERAGLRRRARLRGSRTPVPVVVHRVADEVA